jgi:hypothetical protein
MRRFVVTVVFVCALSGTALAGEIHSTGASVSASQTSSVVATVVLTIISLISR